ITIGHKTHLLWLSKGAMKKREHKRLLRRGVAEAFMTIRLNGSTKFIADVVALAGIDEVRASHILWSFGRRHRQLEWKLNELFAGWLFPALVSPPVVFATCRLALRFRVG